jgi:hypothetical protein
MNAILFESISWFRLIFYEYILVLITLTVQRRIHTDFEAMFFHLARSSEMEIIVAVGSLLGGLRWFERDLWRRKEAGEGRVSVMSSTMFWGRLNGGSNKCPIFLQVGR